MRKALQAEQGKAEMLIKIQNIEEDCAGLDDEVEQLKKRINRLLKDEQADKGRARELHDEDVSFIFKGNQNTSEELKKLLFTFQTLEGQEDG